MATEVILPRVDMDMVDGRIAHWYVKDGEAVRKGQVLFEIETDKATMEVDATADGIIHGIRGEIGVALPVGEVVGWILAPGEAPPGAAGGSSAIGAVGANGRAAAAPAVAGVGADATLAPPSGHPGEAPELELAARGGAAAAIDAPAGEGRLLRATPLARSLARERGINIAAVSGSGPNGRVLGADLLAAPDSEPARNTPSRTAAGAEPSGHGVNLQWMRRGSGAPLVLVHGFGADHGSWRPLLQQLPDGFPVIGIDLPNHGKSARTAVKTFQDLARPLLDRLDQEGVIGFHLLGHSLGGGTALALAPMAAERARSLTLVAPAGLGVDINGGFIDGLVRADDEAALKTVLSQLFHRPGLLTGSFVATAFAQLQAPDRRAALVDLAGQLMPRGRQSQSLRDLFDGLRSTPVQLVWGIEDRIIPVQHSLDAPRHVGLHLLPGVGHLPQVEAAALVGLLAAHLMRQAAAAG